MFDAQKPKSRQEYNASTLINMESLMKSSKTCKVLCVYSAKKHIQNVVPSILPFGKKLSQGLFTTTSQLTTTDRNWKGFPLHFQAKF